MWHLVPLSPNSLAGMRPRQVVIELPNALLLSSVQCVKENAGHIRALTYITGKDFGMTQTAWGSHVFALLMYRV